MRILIKHRTERFISENYRKFETDEFIDHVRCIASTAGVADLPDIHFYGGDEGGIGVCFSSKYFNQIKIEALGFHKKLLDGKSYTVHQIDEVIKHELAHLIANLRYNDNCGHGDQFMAVVKEIGGEPSESLSLIKSSVVFYTEKLNEDNSSHKYKLLCSDCGKKLKQINEYRNVFQLFAISGTDSPLINLISLGNLRGKNPCCNACYDLEADANDLLTSLVADDQMREFQEHLRGLLR